MRRATRRISKLAPRLSSMAVCATSFYRGMMRGPTFVLPALTLISAAQAWNRSDSRAAKALSLRGQSENNLMREAHREAARILYEDRNKDTDGSRELYVDLHGTSMWICLLVVRLTRLRSASRRISLVSRGHPSEAQLILSSSLCHHRNRSSLQKRQG